MSFIYVDSSALIKLVIPERESVALRRWLRGREIVSSRIAQVEVVRGVRRTRWEARPGASELLLEIDLIGVDAQVVTAASELAPPELRSLDAIHLATALYIGEELDGFVTYDRQLGRAATAAGLAVESPR